MRKALEKYYDKDHRPLVADKSVVRYEDTSWLYHGAWLDEKTGKVKVLLSSRTSSKMRLVHHRHHHKIELEYTLA